MSTLLHIAASPNSKEISESLRLADAFLETYHAAHPDINIDTLDLWSEPLIPFDGVKVGAKAAIAGGGVPVGAQAKAWSEIMATFNRFNAAESYLFSVPMWNAGIPYVLKHYIDIITQPGLLFRLDPGLGIQAYLLAKRPPSSTPVRSMVQGQVQPSGVTSTRPTLMIGCASSALAISPAFDFNRQC